MQEVLRVLFIEDSEDDVTLQVRLMEKAGYRVDFLRVETPVDLLRALYGKLDVIISDYSMPHFNGVDALRIVREHGVDLPFIFVSGTIGEDTAVRALKEGASDYLMKSDMARLVPAIQRELREGKERKERKRLERQVQQLQRFESIGRLAGGVAHDFNNVLGAIMGWADLGIEESSHHSHLQERFLKIRAQSERAAALTRQLLAFARRQVLQSCNMDLNALVKEVIALLRNVIGERIEVNLNLAPGQPIIWADPGQVEQVLMNLCINSRDAMPNGGKLSIETSVISIGEDFQKVNAAALPGRYAMLCVSDNGTGILPEALDHIFEPFFSTKQNNGTGLGLATVYGIVKQHKGFIELDSTLGEGSTFRVHFPLGTGVPLKLDSTLNVTTALSGHEVILLAEDNDGLREATKQYLQTLGYEVLTARDGVEAAKIFEQNSGRVDLVLLDVVMPKLNGPAASAQMQKFKSGVPVVFATGHAEEESLMEIQAQVPSLILQKPYGTVTLAQKLREVLDKRRR